MAADGKTGVSQQRIELQPASVEKHFFVAVTSSAASLIEKLGGKVEKRQGGEGWYIRFPAGTQVEMVTARVPGPGMVNPGVTMPVRWLVSGSYKGDVYYPHLKDYGLVHVPPTWLDWEFDANHQGKILFRGEEAKLEMVDLHVNLCVLERGQEVESVLRFFSSLGLVGLNEDDNGMLLVTKEQWEAIDSFQMDDVHLPRFCYPDAWDMKPGDGSEPSPEMAAAIAALHRLER